ncbi:hypothetical protein JKF63_01231 [Porcisia hertigi]|uniref:Uncharacterized protein n=1 Tax=Porcisia hertigi TaxID=2761500 RepID=A0A836L0F8_9TRYP|nr:hypothetical protein JKF63_01231 [Porcisia hertigi]
MRGATVSAAPAEAPGVFYKVHTFFAPMFPLPIDPAEAVTLKVDTAEFLVKNNMDLTRWVKEGLRFSPMKVSVARLAKDAEETLQQIDVMADPHTMLPRYKVYIGDPLDHLLPLLCG